MLPDNGKVMLSWPLAEWMIGLPYSLRTLRLLVSLLHRLDLAEVRGGIGPEASPSTGARCADLRAHVVKRHGKLTPRIAAFRNVTGLHLFDGPGGEVRLAGSGCAAGDDICVVEAGWRAWSKGRQAADHPDRAFLAFCRKYAEAHPL